MQGSCHENVYGMIEWSSSYICSAFIDGTTLPVLWCSSDFQRLYSDGLVGCTNTVRGYYCFVPPLCFHSGYVEEESQLKGLPLYD